MLTVSFIVAVSTFLFLFAESGRAETKVISLDGVWQIATDADNAGKKADWFKRSLAKAVETRDIPVPGVVQQVFPLYHGVSWYEREFPTPKNPNAGGRTILRFYQAEYYAEIWLNGELLGAHEGGEAMFELDATARLRPAGESNRLTVRIINPTDDPVDGFTFQTIPHRNNTNTVTPGCGYASGGLVDSVELLLVPDVRIADLHLVPNWKNGEISVRTTFENANKNKVSGSLTLFASSVDGGEPTLPVTFSFDVATGTSVIERKIVVPNFKLWNLNDPNLYSVTASWKTKAANESADLLTATCGFRDFRFENRAFRLNGKRIYIKCSHSGSDSPITHRLPLDPDLYRKDIIFSKTMGFNMIRYIAGMPRRFQLDLCDRIGLMVYDECLAGWCLGDSPQRTERLYRQTTGMILRDRNHPSVVIWGLLNEIKHVPTVYDMEAFLPEAQKLGPGRMVFLNSGSFDPFAAPAATITDLAFQRQKKGPFMPAAIKNFKDKTFLWGGTYWTANTFFLHPGDSGNEYAVLKWTAPAAGTYKIAATFADPVKDGKADVDIHLFKGTEPLFESFLNLNGIGKKTSWNGAPVFRQGEELSVVVGIGDENGYGDTTAIDLVITSPDGKVSHAGKEYSYNKNPNGVWSYGYLPAGKRPNPVAFKAFDCGQETLHVEPIGRFANPGSNVWQNELADTHPYKSVPHTAAIIQELRTHAKGDLPVFLSEYGIGSGVDLFRLTRLFEQNKGTAAADALHYRDRFDRFMNDWNRWKLEETFYSPEDYFRQTIALMAEQRRIGINALRANANVVGHSVTGTHDQGISGEGLTTIFRELKPGTTDAMADIFAPLRFCCFVEPVQLYRGEKIRFEAVLVNEDILGPGDYPVRYMVVGPGNQRVFDEVRTMTIPVPPEGKENPMVLPVFSEEIAVDGPAGEYRFIAEIQKNGAAAGGIERFFVADKSEWPKVEGHFIVWGKDAELLQRLKKMGIDAVPAGTPGGTGEKLSPNSKIIVGHCWSAPADQWPVLYDAVRSGATVLFIAAGEAFKKGNDRAAFLPPEVKVSFENLPRWLYHKDDWAKQHPIFAGLPAGCVLDTIYYREMVPFWTFNYEKGEPAKAIAGAFNTQMGYSAGLSLAEWRLGKGRMILNTFKILENPNHPVADRMLRNMMKE